MNAPRLAPVLSHGLSFNDLYDRDGLGPPRCRLRRLAAGRRRRGLHARLMAARAAPDALAAKDESNLLIELARPLEDFVGALFGVAAQVAELRGRHSRLAPLYDCKRLFVQRYVTRAIKPDAALALDGDSVTAEVELPVTASPTGWRTGSSPSRSKSATCVGAEFKVEAPTPEIEALARYAAWALHHPEGKKRHRDGPLFKVPHKLDFEHLVPIETEIVDGVTRMKLPRPMLRHREGFALTDEGFDLVRALDHTNYCIWCHNQGKDSCSRGLKDRKTGAFQKSPFGVTLAGCPLEEKISEMNLLKSEGFSDRCAGHGGGRQSAGRRHRASHLQRLHEGLHLPEAGTGRHPADRDPHAEGRARPAVGLRDLLAADALESAQPAPSDPAARDRPHRAGGRPRSGGLQPLAPPDERRPHRGRRSTG